MEVTLTVPNERYQVKPHEGVVKPDLLKATDQYFLLPWVGGGIATQVGLVDQLLGRGLAAGEVPPLLSGHKGRIEDIGVDPFRSTKIATASDDATIKLWDLTLLASSTEAPKPTISLQSKSSAHQIAFHPSARGILASICLNKTVNIFNCQFNEPVFSVPVYIPIYSCCWNYDGSLLAVTTDATYRSTPTSPNIGCALIDPRQKSIIRGAGHVGKKPSKVFCTKNWNRLMTVGFSKTNQELCHWDMRNLTEPAATHTFDMPQGAPICIWDEDASLFFLGSRGTSDIKVFQVDMDYPYTTLINIWRSPFPIHMAGVMPKVKIRVDQGEVSRLAILHNQEISVMRYRYLLPEELKEKEAKEARSSTAGEVVVTADSAPLPTLTPISLRSSSDPSKAKVSANPVRRADPITSMRAPSASLEANEWIQGANKPPRIMAFSAGGILAHDLFNQFGVKDFADGEVLLHHQPSASVSSFPIHRCIMAARSEPLRQYFQKLEDEKRTPVLDLSDIPQEVGEAFIYFIYFDQVPSTINMTTHGETLKTLAKKFQIDSLYQLVTATLDMSRPGTSKRPLSSLVSSFQTTYFTDMHRLFTDSDSYFPDATVYVLDNSTEENASDCNHHTTTSNTTSATATATTTKTGGKEWKKLAAAHKVVFAARSEFFAHTFGAGMAESGGTIKLGDLGEAEATLLLEYLYTGSCNITGDTVLDLWWAAQLYQMTGLVSLCEKVLQDSLDTENCFLLLDRAKTINSRLKLFILNYIVVNYDQVVANNEANKKYLDEPENHDIKDWINNHRPVKMSQIEAERFRQMFHAQKVN